MEKHESESALKTEIISPKMSVVIMLNDNTTTMEFVVYLLQEIFNKSFEQAESIMLEIHKTGSGVCGIYPYDIAHTKAQLARRKSADAGFPLKIIVEDKE